MATDLAIGPDAIRAQRVLEMSAEEHRRTLEDPDAINAMRAQLLDGDVIICRRLLARDTLEPMRAWLAQVSQSSLPNYQPIVPGCPNFHRINDWDERAYVRGGFQQFSFFPWNQDPFRLFSVFQDVFRLKNRVAGLDGDTFTGREPQRGCTARLSFQFYPRGLGGLAMHADPKDYHQITVPVVMLSERGVDFDEGGLQVMAADGSILDLEGDLGWGDAVYFHPQMPHGVANIDPDAPGNWLDPRGRWMVICAVNRLSDNDAIKNSSEISDG